MVPILWDPGVDQFVSSVCFDGLLVEAVARVEPFNSYRHVLGYSFQLAP